MKKIVYPIFIFVLLSAINFGCTKTGGSAGEDDIHQEDQNDYIFPVITITKPTDNQLYANGDSIIIEGKASDNKVMYKGKVVLRNDNTTLVMADQFYETHFLTVLNFRLAFKATVMAVTDFTVTAEFEDHGLNKAIKTLKVKVNP